MTCYTVVSCRKFNGNQMVDSNNNKKLGVVLMASHTIFVLIKTPMYVYLCKAYHPKIKHQVVEMAINGIGIRDTARVLSMHKNTMSGTIKK